MSSDPDDRALARERRSGILKLVTITATFSFFAGVGVTVWLTGRPIVLPTIALNPADRAVPIPPLAKEEAPPPAVSPAPASAVPMPPRVALPSLAVTVPDPAPPLQPSLQPSAQPGAVPTKLPAPAAGEPLLTVRVGSFSQEANATDLADRLEESGYRVSVVRSTEQPGRPLFLVQVGQFQDPALANEVAGELRRRERLDAVVSRYLPPKSGGATKK